MEANTWQLVPGRLGSGIPISGRVKGCVRRQFVGEGEMAEAAQSRQLQW